MAGQRLVENEGPILREEIDILFTVVVALRSKFKNNCDQYRVKVPAWFWEKEMNERERESEVLAGEIPVQVDHELLRQAEVLRIPMGSHEPENTVKVQLEVPVLELWKDAIIRHQSDDT